ncbi:type III-B CRISPR-associated protein Cas10/Cmr2 [Desulfofundulus sp. TPOSR]|uniref:type III-B CRISPR-associated protein Cas10/Cmr2 n=1 Tax=Desulfofundulus sp. TPOSR TaxID=2714340 RepID=UPI001408F786|nr:type III-B CRISPR-associated protein Cas10/Cmr2 [Desulfofundulus sp. TPOSR]NHM27875.1 type III-B CRISPR-associated protein Cas10/Cmr2 [Desulfofundulus sp. TPOSR]
MGAVLIFTVGPVQSFLVQARKAQDLFAGSYLLSHLCRVAAGAATGYGAEIIFPYLKNPSLPNRFVAVLPEGLQPAVIGSVVEETVRGEVRRLGGLVLNRACGSSPPDHGLKQAFFRQLETFFEICWVVAGMEDGDYLKAYLRAEAHLEAIKTCRAFGPLNEKGRKCSLTGEHNALFFRQRRAYLCPEAQEVAEKVLSRRYLAEGECLGALGMLKRCLDLELPGAPTGFPSTAAVALMATLDCLPREMLVNYCELFGDRFDDHFYYEENLTHRTFEREGIPLDVLGKAREARAELEEEAEKKGLRFTRYYAVLCMDADNMGKWVGGHFLENPGELRAFQKTLTQTLGGYAGWVSKYLAPPRGRLVYCGGDDVLAFLNLNHLLSVLEELRRQFPAYEELGPVKSGRHSSTSCGICIAHYKEPLSEVLRRARHAEREAKERGGRDAFALVVLKRSGEIHQAVYHWTCGQLRPLVLLAKLVRLLVEEKVSDRFIRHLSGEFRYLKPPESGSVAPASEEEILRAELNRLLRRAWQGKVKEEETTISELAGELLTLYAQGTLENFLSYLEIAAFLAREVNSNLAPGD